ncbi:DUF2730 family protein [Phreatobacter stygius]|uniref:DUF2730 family protein n=2 Tax=Phreatobacter stygius TaxID=1940610 RepID=A0A4D7B509_9HYPH|nr:DUF2730 family protein [Phreatobacter stygius]
MDPGSIPSWLSIIVTTVALTYTVVASRSRAAKDDVEKNRTEAAGRHGALALKIDQLDDRLTRAEGELEHLPDKDTAHRMKMAIARLEGRLETMDERLKPVAAMASRMQDYLIEDRSR